MRKKWALTIALFLLTISIIGNILYRAYERKESDTRSQWSTIQGTVLSFVEDRYSDPYGGEIWFFVDYAYKVDGRQYSGRQEWVVGELEWSEAPRYSQGQTVTVFYYPSKPERSVIHLSMRSPNDYMISESVFYGGVLAVFCGIMVVWINRRQPW